MDISLGEDVNDDLLAFDAYKTSKYISHTNYRSH
jgi:hypothetical protein